MRGSAGNVAMTHETFPTIADAVDRAIELIATSNFHNPVVYDGAGAIVFGEVELLHICDEQTRD
jgi:hypothetical protein